MPARKPEEVDRLLAELLSAGDLEGVVALYEPGATFVAQPGAAATGHAAIRQATAQFLAMKPTLRLQVASVTAAGDLALLVSKWTLTGTGPDGKPVTMAGTGAEVVRRQADGTWRFVLDNPYAG